MNSLRSEILDYAANRYGTTAEYPWGRYPSYAVLRHPNEKWYAVIMTLSPGKVGLDGDTPIDVMNLKCDPILSGMLRMQPGFFPAYHMNKEQWISVVLDGTVPLDQILPLLDMSYTAIGQKKTRKRSKG